MGLLGEDYNEEYVEPYREIGPDTLGLRPSDDDGNHSLAGGM